MVDTRESASSPPPYIPTAQDGAASPTPKRYPLPADIKPTNFIQISTPDSIRGVYVIDPGLTPPASLMSPSPDREGRKNVHIESQDGHVDVDLFVLPSLDEQRKVSLDLNSWGGSVCVRVVRRGVVLFAAWALIRDNHCSTMPSRRTSRTLVGR